MRSALGKLVIVMTVVTAAAGCGGTSPSATTSSSVEPVATATPAPSATEQATPSEQAGTPWLALEVLTGQRFELRVIDQAGNRVSAPGADVKGSNQTNPDWSPDGTMLTFVMTGSDDRDDLWLVGADGSDPRMLFDCADACEFLDDPAWSPDGSSIAACVVTSVDGADVGTLALVDVQTGSLTEVAAFDATDFCAGPRWSPDGTSIVLEVAHRSGTMMSDELTGVTLSVIDVGTGEVVASLTDPAVFAATADWSAAIGEIVYSALASATASAPDLFAILPDGSGGRQLTDLAAGGTSAVDPTVSPDGSTIVFVAEGAMEGLFILDLAAGEVTPGPAFSLQARHPRFVPVPSG